MKLIAILIMALCSDRVSADTDIITTPVQPKWKDECGSCHIVYPPQLLTGGGWQKVMGELDKHFGTNATMDPLDKEEILNFLVNHAGTVWGGNKSESGMRIIDTPWFERKHRKVPNKIWFDVSVRSPSNCSACHVDSYRGDWNPQSIHIPIPGSTLLKK